MSVIVYLESEQGKLKKSALEVASYGKAISNQLDMNVTAVTFNMSDANELGTYGVDKIMNINNVKEFNAKIYANYIKQVAESENSNLVILSSSANSKYLAPLLAINLNAGYVSNVVALPNNLMPFTVKCTAFTNKAFSFTEINVSKKILSLSNNSFGLVESTGNATFENFTPETVTSNVKIESIDKASDQVSIADADIVVSGGRGLKGPENWGMIEELAKVLGAATACSKPVSDLGWRPHSEHVGQTGKPVASNLYIAIGISGAIQHLAGVNSSKVKVVINSDPEAPFFKAADYGIIGDAFDVVPKLIQKLKTFKTQNS